MLISNNHTSAFTRFVRDELRHHRLAIFVALLALLGAIVMDLIAPWPLKIVVDHVLLAQPVPDSYGPLVAAVSQPPLIVLALAAAAIALIAVLSGLFAYLQIYLSSRVSYQLVHALRRELFAHLQRLSLTFHTHSKSGELLTKVASDTTLIRDAATDWVIKGIAQALLLLCLLSVMFIMNWLLAAVVAATLPLLAFLMVRLNRKIRTHARAQRKNESRLISRLNEVLSTIALVQAFGREDYEQARFDMDSAQSLDTGIAAARASAAVSKLVGVVSALALAGTVFLGGWLAMRGTITPGDLLIFTAYVSSMFKPIRDLGRLWGKFSRARASAERINEMLELVPDAVEAPEAIAVNHLHGDIVFDRVGFSYHGQPPTLNEVSFHIRPGEHVALIGASGSGKSTLVSLLLRLHTPNAGDILIDGKSTSHYTRASLRERIGIVLQETLLIGASIRENIAYGRPDASDEAIEAAARAASAHGFISTLSDGYDSIVGERGTSLSGGQRQRICLARALLKQPDILILDEPTSAVDDFTAAAMENAVTEGQRGKTTIVIGHRFTSLQRFDRVLHLSNGRITEVTGSSSRPARQGG